MGGNGQNGINFVGFSILRNLFPRGAFHLWVGTYLEKEHSGTATPVTHFKGKNSRNCFPSSVGWPSLRVNTV